MPNENPRFSVIIPAYNGAQFLAATIQSVLDQTCTDFELIIVDDASQDHTKNVVGQFDDPRVKYILHDTNKGVAIARKNGLHASTGEIIIYLDQDDLLHPNKLRMHGDVFSNDPEAGFSFNSFINLEYSSRKPRDIMRPPRIISLSDLVLGFPIPPSSWVFRRNWAFLDELWEENTFLHGAEIVHLGRLFLAGCKFAFVDKALQYRWYQSGRIFRDLRGKCEQELACQWMIFSDPRCPPEVLSLQNVAAANIYFMWCNVALRQNETDLAQEYLRKVVELNPAMLKGRPCELVRQWVVESTNDESVDHRAILKGILAQLPPELESLSGNHDWAVGQGYLEMGVRAVIWGRLSDGKEHLAAAGRHGANVDEPFIEKLSSWLMNFEHEFGTKAMQEVLGELDLLLKKLDDGNVMRKLHGNILVNSAFRDYHAGRFEQIPQKIWSAFIRDPKYLTNRGVISMLLHSIFDNKNRSTGLGL